MEEKHQKDLELVKQQEVNSSSLKMAELEKKISELELQLSSKDKDKELAVNTAKQDKEEEISSLKAEIASLKSQAKVAEADNKHHSGARGIQRHNHVRFLRQCDCIQHQE